MLGGAILDGRNRYMCAIDLGIECPREEYLGDDPLAFVISHNLHRRHLTESQRASIAARVENMEHGGRRQEQDANLHLAIPLSQRAAVTRAEAAQMLNVSERSVATALRGGNRHTGRTSARERHKPGPATLPAKNRLAPLRGCMGAQTEH
ncbi:MAG: hypothetical protein Q8O82_06220 [Pseudorhodobacter sp.]|nr:hypothetical protein [Pseudorhodobacter sp.]